MATPPIFSILSAMIAVVVLFLGAALICAGGDCPPPAWDLRVLEWFAAQRRPMLDMLFNTITWLGSLWLLLPVALALIASLAARGEFARAARFTAAFGGAVALAYAVKLLAGRERPPASDALVAMPADLSFPSGHAMQITAFALAAVWNLAPAAQRGRWLAVAAMTILLVGVSRVYLQVHFPSDVLAGTMAAGLWAFAFAPRFQQQKEP